MINLVLYCADEVVIWDIQRCEGFRKMWFTFSTKISRNHSDFLINNCDLFEIFAKFETKLKAESKFDFKQTKINLQNIY